MFDLGWSEMFIIMLVALIVIGPKDLPRAARTLGRWSAKGRSLMREFQRSIDDMAREAELDDIKKEIDKAGRTNIRKSIERTIDPDGSLNSAFDVKERDKNRKATAAEKLKIAKNEDAVSDDPADQQGFNADAAMSEAERNEVYDPSDEVGPEYASGTSSTEREPVTSSTKS